MRIDAHHHFWNTSRRAYYWMAGEELAPIRRTFTPHDLEPLLEASNIEGTILVQTVPDASETVDFLETAESTHFVKGVVGWLDLLDPDLDAAIGRLKARSDGRFLVGIRHQAHDEEDKLWLARPEVTAGVATVGAAGLVYELLVKEPELEAAIRCADATPETVLVLDHIAKPRIATGATEPWMSLIGELARRPNVFCKLSGMVTEAEWANWETADLRPYVDHVLEIFGPDRILFGSDWPVCLLAAEYDRVVAAASQLIGQLSQDEQDEIFGGTASRIYRI